MVLKENELPRNAHMLFEGQMSSYETSAAKIKQVLEAGFRANIIVVHARSEDALNNTLRRFYEEGRGSPIATIAKIQGGLPQSLDQLGAHFGSDLMLDIIDVRDRSNPVHHRGFESVFVLRTEGTNEQIEERLRAAIEHYRSTGRINDEAYRQAAGLDPRDHRTMDQQRHGRDQRDERERGVAQGGREAPVLTGGRNQESEAKHQSHQSLRITDASKAGQRVVGKVIDVTDEHVLVQTGKSDAVRFDRSDLSREVDKGQRISLEFKELERSRSNERATQSREIQPELGDTKQISMKRTQDRG
ncbi:hypothetical protein DBB29_24665 [Pandoraea cepalis]|uniref:Uncharacterized protein n=2 Tax=Pandoraea cepalis TaxID=2508294 RepID=A0AAW7MGH0_9BURK|nr:hypothetical protein [Pandoraea cepalis]MDN4581309.1 hypothetical protein [Pandoraea cepalis]